MTKLVSIITPAYNAEPYLRETVRSVQQQTYSDWELIIVNDGSKDGTEKLAQGFTTDPRIKIISQKNAGVSAARNKGIETAKGDYIAFLDADDTWEQDNLEKKIRMLESSDADWVFSAMYLGDPQMNRIGIAPIGRDDSILENILLWEGEVVPGPCSNMVLKRKCIDAGLRFDTDLSTAADQDYTLQLAAKFKGKYIEEPLWTYRTLPGSMSRNIKVMEKDHIHVYRKAARNKLFHSFTFRRKCFSNLYMILAGSWWVNGGNKLRGTYFIMRSLISYPPHIIKLLSKLVK